jgi:hypothetical protein
LEVDIPPFQSKQFAHPQARAGVQQDKSSLAEPQTSNQLPNLAGTQHGQKPLRFRALPHQSNRIVLADFRSDSMVEKDAHDISDLRAA